MYTNTSENLPRMAVFVDIENFAGYCGGMGMPVDIAPELKALSQTARPVVIRSIGDIAALPQPDFNHKKIRHMLQQNHVQHEDVPHLSSFKNSADIRLVVEAMHLALTSPEISHFAIIANDRDFVPLFLKLRALGKVVMGCGPSRTRVNDYYRTACDLFHYHDELVESPKVEVPIVIQATVEVGPATADEIAPLLQAVRSLNEEGKEAKAPLVGGRLKTLFPDFVLQQTFKKFCQRAAETGRIVLSNVDAPDFILTVAADLAPKPIQAETSKVIVTPLLEAYRGWCRDKLKIAMPTPLQRNVIYCAVADILAARQDALPIPLKTLALLVSEQMTGAEALIFRVLYGLFRCRALSCTLTGDAFNPAIVGIGVPADRLDDHFVANTLAVFIRDNTGLPFDAKAWALFFYHDERADGQIRELAGWKSVTPPAVLPSPVMPGTNMVH